MRVRATQVGHYDGYMRYIGDVFDISDTPFPLLDGNGTPRKDDKGKLVMGTWFTPAWMEKVDDTEALTPLQKKATKHPLEALRPDVNLQPKTLSEVASVI